MMGNFFALLILLFSRQGEAGPLLRSWTPEELRVKFSPAVVKLLAFYEGQRISMGTGFFISQDGIIATNFHVLQYAFIPKVLFSISTYDRHDFREMEVLGCSDQRMIDLCLIRVDPDYRPTRWFSSHDDPMSLGHDVFKIGHGDGLEFHMTTGITVKKEENIPFLLDYRYSENREVEFIQVSARLFPGDSGGPLFDSQGRLMGMTTMKITKAEEGGGSSLLQVSQRDLGISAKEIFNYRQKVISLEKGNSRHQDFRPYVFKAGRFRLVNQEEIKKMEQWRIKESAPPQVLPLVKILTMDQLKKSRDQEGAIIIDVRDPFTFSLGHVPGAINLPYLERSQKTKDFVFAQDSFPVEKLRELVPAHRALVFYSQNSQSWEAYKAAKWMRDAGPWEKISLAPGGWEEWVKMYPEDIEKK